MTDDFRSTIIETINDMVGDIRPCIKGESAREYALVITKLEEASMWLNRGYYKEHPTEGKK